MKRTYAVTILVDVVSDNDRSLAAARKQLRSDPPFINVSSFSSSGSFRIQTRQRVKSITEVKPRRRP